MRQKYTTFHRGLAKVICTPELDPHLEFFTGAFEDWLAEQPVKVFLEQPNRVVAARLPPGLFDPRACAAPLAAQPRTGFPVVVKRFGWRSPFHRIIRSVTGSKAARSFRIGMTLRDAGLATPRPLIAWDRHGRGVPNSSYYITEEIADATHLRSLLQSSTVFGPERTALLTELARLVRGMHDAGILHRDLTLGNFLVAPKPLEGRRIFVIDLSRAVPLGRVPILLRLMDLARIKLGESWPEFFEAYCEGHPNWKAYRPLLRSFVWLRRWKMDLKKWLKA